MKKVHSLLGLVATTALAAGFSCSEPPARDARTEASDRAQASEAAQAPATMPRASIPSPAPVTGPESALVKFIPAGEADLKPNQAQIMEALRKERTAAAVDLVRVNAEPLEDQRVTVQLSATSADAPVELHKNTLTRTSSDNFTWRGGVTDTPYSAQFSVSKGGVAGTIQQRKYVYELRPIGEGLHALIKRDASRVIDHPPETKTAKN